MPMASSKKTERSSLSRKESAQALCPCASERHPRSCCSQSHRRTGRCKIIEKVSGNSAARAFWDKMQTFRRRECNARSVAPQSQRAHGSARTADRALSRLASYPILFAKLWKKPLVFDIESNVYWGVEVWALSIWRT